MYVYNRHKRSVRYLSRWIKYQMTSGHGPRKPWTWVELRPIRTIWFDQPPVGGVQTGQLKRWRASGAHSLLFPLATLGRSWTRRAQTRARLTWKPARWTLSTKPTIGGGLRPCQSRNGATKSTIVRRAFPMTSRSHLKSPHENNRRSRAEHVTPETKNWTHAGKRNHSEPAFKPIQASTNWISNPDWTG